MWTLRENHAKSANVLAGKGRGERPKSGRGRGRGRKDGWKKTRLVHKRGHPRCNEFRRLTGLSKLTGVSIEARAIHLIECTMAQAVKCSFVRQLLSLHSTRLSPTTPQCAHSLGGLDNPLDMIWNGLGFDQYLEGFRASSTQFCGRNGSRGS